MALISDDEEEELVRRRRIITSMRKPTYKLILFYFLLFLLEVTWSLVGTPLTDLLTKPLNSPCRAGDDEPVSDDVGSVASSSQRDRGARGADGRHGGRREQRLHQPRRLPRPPGGVPGERGHEEADQAQVPPAHLGLSGRERRAKYVLRLSPFLFLLP